MKRACGGGEESGRGLHDSMLWVERGEGESILEEGKKAKKKKGHILEGTPSHMGKCLFRKKGFKGRRE